MKIAAFLALIATCEGTITSVTSTNPDLIGSTTLTPVLVADTCATKCAGQTRDSCAGSWTSCNEIGVIGPIVDPIVTDPVLNPDLVNPITTLAPIDPGLTGPIGPIDPIVGAISPRRRALGATTAYNCIWTCTPVSTSGPSLTDPSSTTETPGTDVSNPGDVELTAEQIPSCLNQCLELRQTQDAALVSKGCVDQIKGLCDAFGVLDECKRCKVNYDQSCLNDVRYGLASGFECPRTVDESIGSGAAVVPTLALAAVSALLL